MYPHHVFDLEPAGTFRMYPICYRWVSGRYFQPEPAMYSRCFRWFPGPLAPSVDVGGSAWSCRRSGNDSDEPRDRLDLEIFLIYWFTHTSLFTAIYNGEPRFTGHPPLLVDHPPKAVIGGELHLCEFPQCLSLLDSTSMSEFGWPHFPCSFPSTLTLWHPNLGLGVVSLVPSSVFDASLFHKINSWTPDLNVSNKDGQLLWGWCRWRLKYHISPCYWSSLA